MIVGLTGMSGAGKTTVCDVFENHGFEVIDCDKIARLVVQKGKPCLIRYAELFGDDILIDGELDRKKLGARVFSDKKSLELLNATIYPYISYEILKLIRETKNNILLDAPTLFESGIDYICDKILSVVCDREKSIERIMSRDSIDRQHAQGRLSSQHSMQFFIENSTAYIINNGTKEELRDNAETIVVRLINGEL